MRRPSRRVSRLDTKDRVDAVCRNPTRFVKPMAVDVTVGVPAHQDGGAAVTDAHHTTKALEKSEERHHASTCKALNYDFVPAAFTSFGGWGVTLLAMLQAEYHARKKEEEKKSGGSGWKAQQRWKQDYLERASISIARGNYYMLRENRTPPVA